MSQSAQKHWGACASISFRHSEAFLSETIYKLGFDKLVQFHQAEKTASAKTSERKSHGEFGEEDQCGWSTGYEGRPWWMRPETHNIKGSWARLMPTSRRLQGFRRALTD